MESMFSVPYTIFFWRLAKFPGHQLACLNTWSIMYIGSSFINEYLKILKPDENQRSWNAPQRVFGENGRSSYSHLKLTFRLLLCA
jgi:hypothetical protein